MFDTEQTRSEKPVSLSYAGCYTSFSKIRLASLRPRLKVRHRWRDRRHVTLTFLRNRRVTNSAGGHSETDEETRQARRHRQNHRQNHRLQSRL